MSKTLSAKTSQFPASHLSTAVFQYHVDIFLVGKVSVEAHDISVLELAVQFNFAFNLQRKERRGADEIFCRNRCIACSTLPRSHGKQVLESARVLKSCGGKSVKDKRFQ